jgi:hypothetical protein
MVKVPKYTPKKGGVTADEVPEGKQPAVIKDVSVETKQREKRYWDKKLKARVVELDQYGAPVMEDYQLLRIDYELTDISGEPTIGQWCGLSMNPGDKDGNMRSNLYKNAIALDEVPENGDYLDTDRFIGREVEIDIVHKTVGDTTWANVSGPIVRALDTHQRRLGSA